MEIHDPYVFSIIVKILWFTKEKNLCVIYRESFVIGDTGISLDETSKLVDCFICLSL